MHLFTPTMPTVDIYLWVPWIVLQATVPGIWPVVAALVALGLQVLAVPRMTRVLDEDDQRAVELLYRPSVWHALNSPVGTEVMRRVLEDRALVESAMRTPDDEGAA